VIRWLGKIRPNNSLERTGDSASDARDDPFVGPRSAGNGTNPAAQLAAVMRLTVGGVSGEASVWL